MAPERTVAQAYRHLYKSLLRATRYSQPASTVVRDVLRNAFREKDAVYEPETVKRTIWFIAAAGRESGWEHKVLKNLIRVRMNQHQAVRNWSYPRARARETSPLAHEVNTAYDHYNMTLAMLNKSLSLCLR
ncbi:hypothetical protein S40285_01976 [Stachybotrys chlorohalonatus IBT 40285]|uniref:Uncharacterized protein n=1 Tax=Stachybotrys chlorohalonatus (strain IBT 40285) TaxID=1283841 RepID=A0A084QII7_STAC4|nr:hypothetical protein S40285_01976 [Stachybotrys chlorohalonata IBT 40285]